MVFSNKKKWGDELINLMLNYNVFSLSFSYYFEQFENKKELWNLDEFFEIIEKKENNKKSKTST